MCSFFVCLCFSQSTVNFYRIAVCAWTKELLNKRGTSRAVACSKCATSQKFKNSKGWVCLAECPGSLLGGSVIYPLGYPTTSKNYFSGKNKKYKWLTNRRVCEKPLWVLRYIFTDELCVSSGSSFTQCYFFLLNDHFHPSLSMHVGWYLPDNCPGRFVFF